MSEPARKRVPADEAVPVGISHDEKTIETPTGIPELVLADEITVPVTSSLEKILRHEMLRHRSANHDDADR